MSDAAFRVFTCALSYCAQVPEPTGHMTKAQVRALVSSLGKRQTVIAELVRLNAWEAVYDGYLIHDYDEYLERGSRDRVRAFRERKRAGNVTGNGPVTAPDVTGNESVTESNASHVRAPDGYPVPEPIPVPVPTEPPLTTVRGETPPAGSGEPDPVAEQVERLCQRMQELVAERAKRPQVTAAWRHDARLLLTRDRRPFDEAIGLMEWAAADSFWRRNVLGIPKFREQYDRLRMQRDDQAAPGGPGRAGPGLSPRQANSETYSDYLRSQAAALRAQETQA